MKALKLRLLPTKEQYEILDEMFEKWAAICTRMSHKGIAKENLSPKDNSNGIWFNKTQLNQAETDIKDLKRAMQKQAEQKELELKKIQDRYTTISEMLINEDKKDRNPLKPSNFRPKDYVNAGFLKTKFHTQNYWQKELEKLERAKSKRNKTIEKIKRGYIYFKPKRIGLWPTSFLISFASKKLIIKAFPNGDSFQKPIELYMVTEPLQPEIGKDQGISSQKSKKYISNSIHQFLTFSIHSRFFGMNDTEKRLMRSKISRNIILSRKKNFSTEVMISVLENKVKRKLQANEKNIFKNEFDKFSKDRNSKFNKSYLDLIEKLSDELKQRKIELLNKKFSSIDEKISYLEKTINKNIDSGIVKEEFRNLIKDVDNYGPDYEYGEEYITFIKHLAEILYIYDDVLRINKYPILIRKPMKRYKNKKLHNLKPEQWKYYIQLSYNPIGLKESFLGKSVMGIDRGLTHLLAISVYNPETNKFKPNVLVENPIIGWKWKLRKMKRSIQHLERKTRAQKNVHIFENQMKKRFRSIENRIEDLYHNKSSEIIGIAKSNSAVIVLENLERQGLKQHGRKRNRYTRSLNYTLSLFDYAKIASLIKYKAEDAGIPIFDVLPAGTSQNCAKCILENKSFTEGVVLFYLEDLNVGSKIPSFILEGTGIESAKVVKINKSGIEAEASYGSEIKKIIIKKMTNKINLIDEDKNVIAEFSTRPEGEKTAVLDYIYKRGREIIKDKPKYTGNNKVGFCTRHGQIDADLNAARVIALCKHYNLNDPKTFGTRR